MSAFVVEDKTINRVVSFLAYDREGGHIRRMIQERIGLDIESQVGQETLGKLMFSLNCDAVNQRYGDDQAAEFRPLDYKYTRDFYAARLHAFKALQCWSYQCSEGNIEETPLFQVMDRVRGDMAEMIVSRLKEYDTINWG